MDQETKQCQNCKKSFTIEPEDFNFYERIKVPPPTWCQECRIQRRILFRNERKLFRVKEGITGESILALFPAESGYTIYNDNYWWSDKWDPLAYGQDFDPSRPFLAQLFDLNLRVPKYRSAAINMVNSDYSANADGLKNCYLLFNSNYTEDCGYGNGIDYSRNCYDNSHLQKSEYCYGSFWLTNCYSAHFSSQCEDCTDIWFSKNCRGCTNCIGCINLRNQSYCIFNQPFSKEEYKQKVSELRLNTWKGLTELNKQSHEFWLKFPIKHLQGVQNTNVSGDFISHSKNIYHGYLIRDCENLRYSQYSQVPSSRDCVDGSVIGSHAELMYEVSVCGWKSANLKFCWECWDDARDLEYCIHCGHGVSNLFGCAGVNRRQYCILNKQYSKEDFESLRKKIVEQMDSMPYVDKQGRVYKYGEFFPPEFSPFNYNHTIAPEHFPINKDQILKFGAHWQEISPTEYQTTLIANALPDSIEEVQDSIVKEIIQCLECKRAYRVINPELQFLRQVKIPLPRTCVDCRHMARIKQRNSAKFYERHCMCDYEVYKNSVSHAHHPQGRCSNLFTTSYSPDRPEIVYCEQCYNNEVV